MNRTALITGSSRGIGRAIALRLAKDNFNIIVNYVSNRKAAEDTAARISEMGARCIVVQADVSKTEEVNRLRREAEENFGFIDTVINNAGVSSYGLMDSVSDEEYDRVMNTNLRGVFNICREFYFPMVRNKFGRIVNISSMWGITGASLETIYSASKAAVIGLTKALAKELAPSGVTVNAVAPGVIKTDMINQIDENTIKELISETPVSCFGMPEDVAEGVAFLVSKKNGFITGEVINVNGGFVI